MNRTQVNQRTMYEKDAGHARTKWAALGDTDMRGEAQKTTEVNKEKEGGARCA